MLPPEIVASESFRLGQRQRLVESYSGEDAIYFILLLVRLLQGGGGIEFSKR